MPALSKTYHVMIHDGHWRLEGDVTFSGRPTSGWTNFRVWIIDGADPTRTERLNFTTEDWQRMGDSTVTIRRSGNPGQDYFFKQFALSNNNGYGENCSIHLS